MSGDPFDDTEPQPVLRVDAEGRPIPPDGSEPVEPTDADDLLPLAAATTTTVPDRPGGSRSRRAGPWLVAAATAAVVALGATGYLLSRQSPAAAQGPAGASSASSSPEAPSDPQALSASPSGSDAPLPPGQNTLVLGDSLALAVYPYLADLVPDRYVSYVGEVGSSTAWALDQVEQLQANGERVPRVVLVSAGTNDWYAQEFRDAATELLDRLGPRRCVVWSTVARPTEVNGMSVDPAEDLNAVLLDLAVTHPNLRVLDWAGAAQEHPAWLAGDGVHPNEEGTIERAQMFADASYACSPRDPDAPVADKQYLPLSSFYVGGTPGAEPTYAPSAATTPRATHSSDPTPTRTRTPKPTKTAKPTPTQTEPPPPTQTEDPPAASDPPPGDDGGGDAG